MAIRLQPIVTWHDHRRSSNHDDGNLLKMDLYKTTIHVASHQPLIKLTIHVHGCEVNYLRKSGITTNGKVLSVSSPLHHFPAKNRL
ncbi:hypothetical protein HanRHA438_Chr13g0616501 [Helianthus annuus]|nr:hypothetical protein HanHA300_Chr13g0496921 [Helianthus annuus]KAJ0499026.1 hypothetical protein HanHA89_Chr13g0529571 [Helianthus annuus]KAJ0665040.1 hypothetical protein HanLR1_Chr13g0499601 [Helianthus annuus]KAJ0859780.1 hypothetical protein HanRHA438_Chr13g0616501 [Helianthus annuus]